MQRSLSTFLVEHFETPKSMIPSTNPPPFLTNESNPSPTTKPSPLELLSTWMSSPEFQKMKHTSMVTWSDMETITLFLCTEEYLQQEFEERFHRRLSGNEIQSLLYFLFSDTGLTRQAVDFFRFYQNQNRSIRECRRRYKKQYSSSATKLTNNISSFPSSSPSPSSK